MEICERVPPAYGSLDNSRIRTSTFDDRHNIRGGVPQNSAPD